MLKYTRTGLSGRRMCPPKSSLDQNSRGVAAWQISLACICSLESCLKCVKLHYCRRHYSGTWLTAAHLRYS